MVAAAFVRGHLVHARNLFDDMSEMGRTNLWGVIGCARNMRIRSGHTRMLSRHVSEFTGRKPNWATMVVDAVSEPHVVLASNHVVWASLQLF